jgi:hypothetical protein
MFIADGATLKKTDLSGALCRPSGARIMLLLGSINIPSLRD